VSSPAAPVRTAQRIVALDVLRGVALLGILVINIRYFALPLRAGNDPRWHGGALDTADFWTWFSGNLLFEDKMIALFSMLFGAGIVLTASRSVLLHLSRHFWLLLIGAAHAFFIWHGDVLMIYAVCGILLTPLRRAPAYLLLPLGILAILGAVGSRQWAPLVDDLAPPPLAVESTHPQATAGTASQLNDASMPSIATEPSFAERRREAWGRLLGQELEVHQSDYRSLFVWRAELNLWWHYYGGLFNLLRCGGFMLIGMALLRLGVLDDRRGTRFNLGLATSGFIFGGALTLLGMHPQLTAALQSESITEGEALGRLRSFGYVIRHLAAIPLALAWVGAILIFRRTPFL